MVFAETAPGRCPVSLAVDNHTRSAPATAELVNSLCVLGQLKGQIGKFGQSVQCGSVEACWSNISLVTTDDLPGAVRVYKEAVRLMRKMLGPEMNETLAKTLFWYVEISVFCPVLPSILIILMPIAA